MKNFELFKKDFKRDLLVQIVVGLKYGKISKKKAAYIAKQIIAIFKEEEKVKVFNSINKLAETNPDVLDIFIKRAGEYEQREKEEKLAQIHVYLTDRRWN